MNNFDFAFWLEDQLARKNMTKLELAYRAGIYPSYISHYIYKHKMPTLKIFLMILDALGMHMYFEDDES